MPAYQTNFVPKADIAIYRAGAYVRSYPGGATAATRGTALLTARTAAASGDTIVVGPGAYTLTTGQLLKNGVNWHFANGATVTKNHANYGGLFDDSATYGAGEAVTCIISGSGKFIYTSTDSNAATERNSLLILTNTSSNVTIHCHSLADTSVAESNNGCIRHAGGTLSIHCETISSTNANGVWWSDGELYVNCDTIITGRNAVYSSANDAVGSGDGHITNIWQSGHMWINARKIIVSGGSPLYAYAIYTVSDITTPRVWIDAYEIECTKDGPAVYCGGNFVYIRSMKVFNSFAGTVLSIPGTSAVYCVYGTLWLNVQKIVGGKDKGSGTKGSAINFASGTAFINAENIEDNGVSTQPLIYSDTNTVEVAGTLNLKFQTCSKAANGVAIKSSEALNTINVLDGKITTQASQYDLEQSAGTLNVAAGVEFDRAKTSGTITWLGSQSVFRALNSVAAVTLTDGATPALNAALGKVFRLTAAGNRTIAVPSNPTDGQAIIIEHTASGGSRTLALNTGTGGFSYTAEVTALTATASGKTDRIGCIYNLAANTWWVVAYSKQP